MRRAFFSGFIAAALLGSVVCLPAQGHAQRAAIQIVSMYMSTQEAYNAYNAGDARPPKVQAFPEGVAYVGVYIQFNAAKLKSAYRVGFTYKGVEVRHGAQHTFAHTDGDTMLSIPADELQEKGAYKATLYVGKTAVQTIGFTVIGVPSLDTAYMITGKAWDAYTPAAKKTPPRATGFAGGVTRVGVYFSYSGMAKSDVYYLAVYDAHGARVHRSLDHHPTYAPDGDVAIILPADSGAYPKGHYRTDLYIDGAMVKSLPWTVQ